MLYNMDCVCPRVSTIDAVSMHKNGITFYVNMVDVYSNKIRSIVYRLLNVILS